MRKADLLLLCVPWLLLAPHADAQPQKLEFDAASVRRHAPDDPGRAGVTTDVRGVTRLNIARIGGGPGSSTPDRFSWTGANVHNLLVRAYGLMDRDEQVSGPDWIDSEFYDILVTMPRSTTEPQFQEMLQNLLADRFKLVIHHERKIIPVYQLVVAKNGPKLKRSVPSPAGDTPPTEVAFNRKEKDGFLTIPPGYGGAAMTTGVGPSGVVTQNWFYGQHTMTQFAGTLKTNVRRNVIDTTGLDSKYDIKLYFEPEVRGAPDAIPDHPLLTIFEAIEQQLGLKLIDAKQPFEVVVVDSGDKNPSEN